jgi:hypothetical protein
MTDGSSHRTVFNSSIEVGLRLLCILTAGAPNQFSLERLTFCDYMTVHSDDIAGGPPAMHPRTPHRGGELLVRRGLLQDALLLFTSRGLVELHYRPFGLAYGASDRAAAFLDALQSRYVRTLRSRAEWVILEFGRRSDGELATIAEQSLGKWSAEFSPNASLGTSDD